MDSLELPSIQPPRKFPIPIFALIIGIDEYQNINTLSGACRDADAIYACLTTRLLVPHENIVNLRNVSATRSRIIKEISSLASNESIMRDDAIIIYFAGHGGRAGVPKEWEGYVAAQSQIEIICPVDIFEVDGKGVATPGIPDRLLNQLLHELSYTKSNNITLILDCCHSAGMSRSPLAVDRVAGVWMVLNPPPLPGDYDNDIYSRAAPTNDPQAAYVLLAAAARDQAASEYPVKSDKGDSSHNRGYFTTTLVDILEHERLEDLTYSSVMRGITPERFLKIVVAKSHENASLETDVLLRRQTPHFEGRNIHCPLFYNKDPNHFIPGRVENSVAILDTGEVNGIQADSTFAVYAYDTLTSSNIRIGTFTVGRVHQTQTEGSFLPSPDIATATVLPPHFYAKQVPQEVAALYFEDDEAASLWRQLAPGERLGLNEVTTEADADLRLSRSLSNRNELVFDWAKENQFTQILGTRIPGSILFSEPGRLLYTLRTFAHFKYHLWRNTELEMAPDDLEVELRRLEGGWKRKPGPHNLFNDDSIGIGQNGQSDPLCLLVQNHTDFPLYLYIFYFGSNLRIEPLFSPGVGAQGKKADPSVLPGSTFSVGYGDGGHPFYFALPEGVMSDVGFLKIFLSTLPIDCNPVIRSSPLQLDSSSSKSTAHSDSSTAKSRMAGNLIHATQRYVGMHYRPFRFGGSGTRRPLRRRDIVTSDDGSIDNSEPHWGIKSILVIQKRIS